MSEKPLLLGMLWLLLLLLLLLLFSFFFVFFFGGGELSNNPRGAMRLHDRPR